MKHLTELANKYKSDKGTKEGGCHAFSEIYDDYLINQRDIATNVLEIGIWDGSSLNMWYDYFPNAKIIGLDIEDKKQYENERITCKLIDQSSEDALSDFVLNCDVLFDFIIDDGSHHMRDQQITFAHFFNLLKPGGIYVIEDLHTSLCKSGTILYNRPIEIYHNNDNTTLEYLIRKPLKSVFISEAYNNILQQNVKDIFVHRRPNQLVTDTWGNESITSVIIKK
jgi:SAM-dependent methyltransferase